MRLDFDVDALLAYLDNCGGIDTFRAWDEGAPRAPGWPPGYTGPGGAALQPGDRQQGPRSRPRLSPAAAGGPHPCSAPVDGAEPPNADPAPTRRGVPSFWRTRTAGALPGMRCTVKHLTPVTEIPGGPTGGARCRTSLPSAMGGDPTMGTSLRLVCATRIERKRCRTRDPRCAGEWSLRAAAARVRRKRIVKSQCR